VYHFAGSFPDVGYYSTEDIYGREGNPRDDAGPNACHA
jgi:hypothetical protein